MSDCAWCVSVKLRMADSRSCRHLLSKTFWMKKGRKCSNMTYRMQTQYLLRCYDGSSVCLSSVIIVQICCGTAQVITYMIVRSYIRTEVKLHLQETKKLSIIRPFITLVIRTKVTLYVISQCYDHVTSQPSCFMLKCSGSTVLGSNWIGCAGRVW